MTQAERYDADQASCQDCYNMMHVSFSRPCRKHTNPELQKVFDEQADRYERMGIDISETAAENAETRYACGED